MIRTLLTTTALTALLVGGAMAQNATTTATPAAGALTSYTARSWWADLPVEARRVPDKLARLAKVR